MAVDRIQFSADQIRAIESLREWAQLSEEQVRKVLITGGLTALRLQAATQLYTTQPLSSGEVADRVGLNRGILLDWFHTHAIAPWTDPREVADGAQAMDQWLARELSH